MINKIIIRKCTKCLEKLDIKEFRQYTRYLASWCKNCQKEYNREYRRKNIKKVKLKSKKWIKNNKHKYPEYNKKAYNKRKDKKRDVFLRWKFNITLEDYNNMFKEQDGKCMICKRPERQMKRILCVDHDHKTNKVRGLLCNHCNAGIGMFQDNTEFLKNAINYLTNNQTGSTNGQ